MNQQEFKKSLSKLRLGDLKYFDSIGSTNDEALAWAANDTPDLSLVVADEQTAGRGRQGRKWFTPKETALACSLLLRPTAEEKPFLTRIVGLAALAVTESLRMRGLNAQIKWPNDVLINNKKVAGIDQELCGQWKFAAEVVEYGFKLRDDKCHDDDNDANDD